MIKLGNKLVELVDRVRQEPAGCNSPGHLTPRAIRRNAWIRNAIGGGFGLNAAGTGERRGKPFSGDSDVIRGFKVLQGSPALRQPGNDREHQEKDDEAGGIDGQHTRWHTVGG